MKKKSNKILMDENIRNIDVKILTGERKKGQKEDYDGLMFDHIVLFQNFSNLKSVFEEMRTIFEKYKLDENLSIVNKVRYPICPKIESIKNNIYYGLDKGVEKISNFLNIVESIDTSVVKPELHNEVRDFFSSYTLIFGMFGEDCRMFLEYLDAFGEKYKNLNEKEKN